MYSRRSGDDVLEDEELEADCTTTTAKKYEKNMYKCQSSLIRKLTG